MLGLTDEMLRMRCKDLMDLQVKEPLVSVIVITYNSEKIHN